MQNRRKMDPGGHCFLGSTRYEVKNNEEKRLNARSYYDRHRSSRSRLFLSSQLSFHINDCSLFFI